MQVQLARQLLERVEGLAAWARVPSAIPACGPRSLRRKINLDEL
jgi:hypothetical protein